MKIIALVSALLVSSFVFAAPQQPFTMIHVADLQKAMDAKGPLYVFDVNNEKTRKEEGVIPGAKLLPSSSQYDAKATLPADKKAQLVFYCANTECTASHTAAKRAAEAGYTNVQVMSDGIQGWKKAGKKIEKGG